MAFDPNDPETKAALDAAAQAAAADAKRRADAVEQQLADATERLQQFDGLDADALRDMLAKVNSEEELALLKDGKVDELVERRLSRERKRYEQLLEQQKAAQADLTEQNTALRTRALDSAIRDAATAAGVAPTALEDAVLRARGKFELDADGDVAAVSGEIDANGAPLKVSGWLDSLRAAAPHLFNQPKGTGATGNHGRTTQATSNKKWGDYSESERMELFKTDRDAFEQLKKTQ